MPLRPGPAKLIFFCAKMAAGKTTLARQLAERDDAVLIAQDPLLAALYPGEVLTIADYARCSARLREALTAHVRQLLARGVPVVLDFPANTLAQRAWFRKLFERVDGAADAPHELHVIEASDALCKRQLAERSKGLPPGTPWTTAAEFDAITAYYQPPTADEGFVLVVHGRD